MAEQQATATADAGTPAPTAGQTGASATPAKATTEGGKGTQAAPDSGKAAATPVGGEAGAAGANAGSLKEDGTTELPAWDDETTRWMESKGYELSAFDPANETHTKFIQSNRASEAEITRRLQAEKAAKTLEETKSIADPTAEDAQDPTPMEEWENVFEFDVGRILMGAGVETVQDLYESNPKLYAQIEQRQVTERQEAWEKTQEWKAEKAEKARQEGEKEKKYARQMQEAKVYTDKILGDLRSKNPNLDASFKTSGVNDVLKELTDVHALPQEILFLSPKVASFFAKAATAIAYQAAEPERVEQWKQDYEKKKLGISAASAPAPAGSDTSPVPRAFVVPKTAGERIDASKVNQK